MIEEKIQIKIDNEILEFDVELDDNGWGWKIRKDARYVYVGGVENNNIYVWSWDITIIYFREIFNKKIMKILKKYKFIK